MNQAVGIIKQNNFSDMFLFPPRFGTRKFKCFRCNREVELSIFRFGRRCPHCGGELIPKHEEVI